MKKISMFFVALAIIMAHLTPSVFALSVTPLYNASTGDITLSGIAEGIVSVRITPDAMSDASLSKDTLPVVYHQFEADGDYSVTLRMPSAHRVGKYTVYVTDADSAERRSIICYDKKKADALIDSASSLSDEKFVEALTSEENAKKLGIDTTDPDYSANTISIMAKLYDSYTDSGDFTEKYNYCKALNSLLGKEQSGVEETLVKYEAVLGIDYDSSYGDNDILTDEIKESLCTLLSEMDYASNISYAEELTGEKGFEAYIMASSALAGAKTYEDWKGLEKLYTKDFKFLKSEIVDENSDYGKYEPRDVFGELNKKSFDELSDLGTNFDEAVKTVKQNASSSEKPSKGSGGGSSVSVGGGSSFAPSYETLPEENEGKGKITYSLPLLKEGTSFFADVNSTDWFGTPVSALSASGIINGYNDGSFKPLNSITRAEFTKLVTSAFSITGINAASFEDVSADAWYAECIKNASGAEIITGYEGRFNPESPITRQDAAVIMGRVVKLFNIEYAGYKAFDDMENVSLYAATTVGAFYSNGILNGNGQGSFNPLDNITRAEASQLIYNLVSDMIARS